MSAYPKETVSLLLVVVPATILILSVEPVFSNLVTDKVSIECGTDPVTSSVNVSYFGEADCIFPINHQMIVESCTGEFRADGTYVLVDVNHRNCTFSQIGKTKAWTIRVKIRNRRLILTALDKEFSLTCVYDNIKVADSP